MTRELAARRDGAVRWLVPASVLHVALALLAAALSPGARRTPEGAASRPRSLEPAWGIEFTLLDDGDGLAAVRAAPSRTAPAETALPFANDERRQSRATAHVARPDADRVGTGPSPRPEVSRQEVVANSSTPVPLGRDEPPASTAGNGDPLPPAAGTLSLDQLGIGSPPFLGIPIEPLTKQELVNARLQAALHPPSVERDRQRGRGPAVPVAAAARRLVLADDGLVETSAVLNVRVDGAGHVTEVQVLEAASQGRVWQMLATRLAQALEPLTLPAGSKQGWGMKLRLASRVQLPSGAAPGMRMGVLGQKVAGSGGPGSTGLELSPTAKLDLKEPIDSIGRHLDAPLQFEVMLLKFRADPADIGATARRVVEVAVLSLDELATE